MSYKLKNNKLISSKGIEHNGELLSDVLQTATTSKNGLMSSRDKTNLDNLYNSNSTYEQKIGTWINNKPLYRKIVDVKLVNGFTEPVPYADNVAICHIVAGWIETEKVNMMIPTTDLHWYVRPYINADGLTVDQTNSDYVGKKARFIVEYTKTTD